MCVLFFLCLSFAGVTSLISNIELMTHTLFDFGGTYQSKLQPPPLPWFFKWYLHWSQLFRVWKIFFVRNADIIFAHFLIWNIIITWMLKYILATSISNIGHILYLVPRKIGMPLTVLVTFLVGMISALDIDVLTNQVNDCLIFYITKERYKLLTHEASMLFAGIVRTQIARDRALPHDWPYVSARVFYNSSLRLGLVIAYRLDFNARPVAWGFGRAKKLSTI